MVVFFCQRLSGKKFCSNRGQAALKKKRFCFQQKFFFSSRKFCPGFCMRHVFAFIVGFVTMKNKFLNPVKIFSPVGYAPGRWRAAPPPHGFPALSPAAVYGVPTAQRTRKNGLLYHIGVPRDVPQSATSP